MLPEKQVDIWTIHIDGQREVVHERRLLSADEVERADRFYFEKHRLRFIHARAAMRQILGGYLTLEPQKLAFSYAAKGKPELSGETRGSGIKFNLSHSEDLALLAVTQGLTVGVDIELVNPEFASEEIAERFFSVGEVQSLQALPSAERTHAFFACWTRKEAYIKALGEGLSVPLDSFEVAFIPGVPAQLLEVQDHPEEVIRWSMYDMDVAKSYRAALVVEGAGHRLCHRKWNL